MSELKPWVVVTPEYGTVIPIVDGQGPMEYGCDLVYVEAETRRDALHLGVKLMKQRGDDWFDNCENPYAGIKVLPAHVCEHGRGEWERCRDCETAWATEEHE